jgi:AI-E2 family membrane protein
LKYAIVATIGVGIGLSILGAVSTLATVLIYIGIAVFLSLAFDPVIQLVTRRHFPRWAATIALGLVFLAAIVGLVFTLIPSATEQVTILGDQLFDFGRDLPQQEWFIWVSTNIGASVDLHAVLAQVTSPGKRGSCCSSLTIVSAQARPGPSAPKVPTLRVKIFPIV